MHSRILQGESNSLRLRSHHFFLVTSWIMNFIIVGCDNTSHPHSLKDPSADSTNHLRYARCFQLLFGANDGVLISILEPVEDKQRVLQEINWKFNSIQRLGCLSTTHFPFIQALGGEDLIVASGFSEMKHNPEFAEAIQLQRILNIAAGGAIDKELLLKASPELFFTYPFGGNSCQEFLDARIGCVQVTEYLEEHPLGRAEWIKLFGVMLNRYSLADSIFQKIEHRYNEQIHHCNRDSMPLVFFGTFDGEAYYAPPGNSFVAQLIQDAGAKYYFENRKESSNIRLDKEQMIAITREVDYMGTIEFGKAEWNENIRSIATGGCPILFRCDAANRDYYGKALLEPDALLRDFKLMFHNSKKEINADSLSYFEMLDVR